MYNSNSCIGSKLAFYRYKYSLDMHDSNTASMKIINGQNLSDYQSSTVNNLSTLIEMRAGNNFVNGFTLNEINQMIEILANVVDCQCTLYMYILLILTIIYIFLR